MNILFVISSLGIGGEQRVASILTHAFVEKGYYVDLLVFGSKQKKQYEFDKRVNIIYYNIKNDKFSKLKKLIVTRKALKKRYDIVIGFAVIPSIVCSLASVGRNTPVVVCERNDPMVYGRQWKFFRRISYIFATAAVFQTNAAKESLPFMAKKIRRVIPNPLELENLPDLYTGERKKRIVNTARLTTVKNQLILIKAFEKIMNYFPEYTLCIYGDGPEKTKIEKYIDTHSLSERVHINEAVPNVIDLIKKDSLFVLASKNEGFPNSLAEALAMGLPSISTDCRIGGPKDMLFGKNRGLLVKVDDIDELADAMYKVLGDENIQKKYSCNATTIREELDSKKICSKWIELLNFIVS